MPWLAKPRNPQEADGYSRLRQGPQVLLIGDALSVQVVFHNLTGRNFQSREAGVESLVPWETLRATCEAYRHYLEYMEEDLGIALNPDDLEVEIEAQEDPDP
jgi:hypothetical protein